MANIITGIRIVCSMILWFCPVFSPSFYLFYITAGLTDMIDGTVARMTRTATEFGARLDTFADFVFAAVGLCKLLPALDVPMWVYLWTALIALIKAANLISGYVLRKKPVTLHTLLNKVTGALLFILPLTLPVVDFGRSAALVCAVATAAAVQEGHYIRTGRVIP